MLIGMGNNRLNQDQFFNLISSDELSWQAIIYDLIKTEQLDPWDIDLATLAEKYINTIQALEEMNFFISSKILLACSLLLRLKSEILINSYIKDLNDVLYGKKESGRPEVEKIEVDENDLPILSLRTPMARRKKVTLPDLLNALDHAINTESRRIRKEIKHRQHSRVLETVMPKDNFVPLKVRVKSIFNILKSHLRTKDHMGFHDLARSKEEQLASFVPMLHLSNNGSIFLRQTGHFRPIHMTLSMHPDEQIEIDEELDSL
jgi:segregation and condensation protein A